MKNLANSTVNQGTDSKAASQANSERPKINSVTLIYVPMYYGGPHRGTSLGPAAMRVEGLREQLQQNGFRIADEVEIHIPESKCWIADQEDQPKCVPEIATASLAVAAAVEKAMADNTIPITIGGDHSIAIGSIAGVSAYYRARNEKFGIMWFDAHGDINLPATSHSGNVHGMPMAVALGEGHPSLVGLNGHSPKAESATSVLIGIRCLDEGERHNIARMGVTAYTMHEVDLHGIGAVTQRSIEVASKNTAGIHLSFDIDVMDPDIAPGVSTPSRGGLNYREVCLALELLAESGMVRSIDIAELNPMTDVKGRTTELAVQIPLTALGTRILAPQK